MTQRGGRGDGPAGGISDGLLYAFFILVASMFVVPGLAGSLFDVLTEGRAIGPSEQYKDTLRAGCSLIAQGVAMIGLTVHRVSGRGGLGLPLSALGLGKPRAERRWKGEIVFGLIAGIGLTGVNVLGSWLTQLIFGLFMDKERLAEQIAQESASVVELLGGGETTWVALLLPFVAVVVAPISEEVFFRGYLYGVLRHRFRADPWYAVYWSSAVFALVHFYVIHFIPVFLIGMALAYLYRRRGSLAAPITAHATANFIVTAASLIGQGGG